MRSAASILHALYGQPAVRGECAAELVETRARTLAFSVGYDLVPGGSGMSDARWAVAQLARYAVAGEPPEGRRELVHEYLVSLVNAGLAPDDLDPEDDPAGDETEQAVHLVVLAVLARERLADDEAVPMAWLAAIASTQPSYVRRLVGNGELRRWRRGIDESDRRVYVHPDDAKRWLAGRR